MMMMMMSFSMIMAWWYGGKVSDNVNGLDTKENVEECDWSWEEDVPKSRLQIQ